MRGSRWAWIFVTAGCCSLVVGAALIEPAIAFMVAGVLLAAFGLLVLDVGGGRR